jgi:septal ring factor EnvC (AmiA/AmiB activator)
MTAVQFWTLLGSQVALASLLVAVFGLLLRGVWQRLDRMEGRLDRMEDRLDRMDARLDQFSERLAGVEAQVIVLSERLSAVEARLAEHVRFHPGPG